jgi:hypothetical protein
MQKHDQKAASTGMVSTACGTAIPEDDERHPDQIEIATRRQASAPSQVSQ